MSGKKRKKNTAKRMDRRPKGHVHGLGPDCMMTSVHPMGATMGPDSVPVIHVGTHDVCGAPVVIRDLDDVHAGLRSACALCGHEFRLQPPTQADYDQFSDWAHEFFAAHEGGAA